MNGLMHPDRSGLRSALMASAAIVGLVVGAIAGYGCSQGSAQRSQPLPIAAEHRTPRVPPMTEPPAAVAAADTPAPIDPYEPRPAVPSTEPDLRVRIAALRSSNAVARLSHPSGALVMETASGAPKSLRSPVEVRAGESQVTVTEGVGTTKARTITLPGRAEVDFRAPVGARAVVAFDGTDWPGMLRVVPVNPGAASMDLVVSVPLEKYLPGVLARELFKNWSPETFKAQAIAARSFAVCEREHWAKVRHYDLVAGEASQAWIGEVKDARPRQAVSETTGMVLVFEDRVVPAYYSSTCGGTPANAVDALTRNPHHGIAPLLAGADAGNAHRDCCRAAPRYRWEQEIAVSRVVSQLRRWAGDQRAAERVAMAAVDAGSPAPTRAPAWRTESPVSTASLGEPLAASVAIEGEAAPQEADSVAGVAGLAPGEELATDAPIDQLAEIRGLRSIEVLEANTAGRPIRVRLVDTRGVSMDMRAEDFRRAVNYAREGEPTPRERLNSSNFSATVRGATVEFTGSGFGHGVGMCQFGAEAMAQRGATAQQILRTYYPQAAVKKAY